MPGVKLSSTKNAVFIVKTNLAFHPCLVKIADTLYCPLSGFLLQNIIYTLSGVIGFNDLLKISIFIKYFALEFHNEPIRLNGS